MLNLEPKVKEEKPKDVFVAATIRVPLQDQTVPEEETIALKATIAGEPFPDIKW